MLIERLLWPVPRIRWEVGRSLARLIREGSGEAKSGLLNWIARRNLESEAVLGLGIIDAFSLGPHFEFTSVRDAVQVPSLLSDNLLKRNFSNAVGLSPFRYSVSPAEAAALPDHQETWFDRYRTWAVAPVFSTELERLEEICGFGLMARWKHDWRWLQASNPRPAAEYPRFFSGPYPLGRAGQFDQGQRELYVSAFLRTLAYASITGVIPHELGEHCAMLALTMNRGLADLEPIERPDWACNLLPFDSTRTSEFAHSLWTSASVAARPEEELIALRVVDVADEEFVELDLTLVVGPTGLTSGPPEAQVGTEVIDSEFPSDVVGIVGRDAALSPHSIDRPRAASSVMLLYSLGRVHIDLACGIRLASPCVFRTSANVRCGPSEIRLEANGTAISRWIHWYADWQPAKFRQLESPIGSLSTVSRAWLEELRARPGVEVARLVRARHGTKQEIREDREVQTHSCWI